jgi:hypothetical protein
MVLQGWFDDSGKGQPPVYLLAGYVGDKETWEGFADNWQAELSRPPSLPYMHVAESQIFKGMSSTKRIDRTLAFVDIIARHRLRAVAFLLKHSDYNDFFKIITAHPLMRPVERRMLHNPYFIAFQRILTLMLSLQAKTLAETHEHHMIEILFDNGMDRTKRLELAFDQWVNVVREKEPTWLDFLINKKAEFRDDKFFMPLQASDLLAWHLRRYCFEGVQGKSHADDPIWKALRKAADPELFPYQESDFVGLLEEMRSLTFGGI